MDKEQQKKLITEIMNDDEKDGLYEPVTSGHTLTAIEWLIQQLQAPCRGIPSHIIEQAKQMEKKQIVEAYKFGLQDEYVIGSEKYYNETYNK